MNNSRNIHIVITLAVMAFIFMHSAMPGELSGSESRYFAEILASITGMSFQAASFIVRKAAHFTEFTVLGICLAVDFNDWKYSEPVSKRAGILFQLGAWAAGTLYAFTDEFHQLFVEGRSCELRDVCIDAVGVAVGIVFAAIIRKIRVS